MSVRRLECVITCCNYSDFLAETLPNTVTQFDRVVVVTSQEDRETQQLCAHLSVECRTTDLMYKEKNEDVALCDTLGVDKDNRPSRNQFSKGRAIDYGLAFLQGDDWVVHLDADIWLPPMFRNWFNWMEPKKDCIYGMDRFNCVGYNKWASFRDRSARDSSHHQFIRHCLVIPPADMPLGARIAIREYGGYVPIGFFQAWHAGSTKRRYPHAHGSAERTDVLHSLQWPNGKRIKMAEAFCIHLESKGMGRMGANWNGRRTPQFGPYDPFGLRSPGLLPKEVYEDQAQPKVHQVSAGHQLGVSKGHTGSAGQLGKAGPVTAANVPDVNVNVNCFCQCSPCCCNGYGYGDDGYGPTPIVVVEE